MVIYCCCVDLSVEWAGDAKRHRSSKDLDLVTAFNDVPVANGHPQHKRTSKPNEPPSYHVIGQSVLETKRPGCVFQPERKCLPVNHSKNCVDQEIVNESSIFLLIGIHTQFFFFN